MCTENNEIILVSSQAQSIPYYCNNLLEFPSMLFHFALGTKPDAIILCVNFYDEIQYIRNTMYALIGLTDATILAFVIFPLTYSVDTNGTIYGNTKRKITYDEFKRKSEELQNEFGLPTFLSGELNDMGQLCDRIIDFF